MRLSSVQAGVVMAIGAVAGISRGAAAVEAGAAMQERYVSYVGQASGADASDFSYGEKHQLHYRNAALIERVVLYTCRDGSAFARKTVEYLTPMAPNFFLEDQSNGMREGVRGDGRARSVFFRPGVAQTEKTGSVTPSSDLVVDAGFDEFIRSRWQTLLSGQPQSFDFVVPSRVTSMRFAVKHVRGAPADGVPSELFELKVSGIAGWIAPTIRVYYGTADHMLTSYEGVTDLRDKNGDNYTVHIRFAPRERKESSATEFDEARRATLHPCTSS